MGNSARCDHKQGSSVQTAAVRMARGWRPVRFAQADHCRRFTVKRWTFIPPWLSRKLLEWGKEHHRDLPWRQTNSAFTMLVAEMLLRKTTAVQVAGLFDVVASGYGTPALMAHADPVDLEVLTTPLGLAKQRSVALVDMARYLLDHHGGTVPANPRALAQVPHVGPYAANAVGCFFYGLPLPVVDANVIRVFDRFCGQKTPGPNPHRQASIWIQSAKSLPEGSAADYNYAILDLAATVCKGTPQCSSCPLKSGCYTAKEGRS